MDNREGEEREEGLTKEKEEKKLVQRTERQEAKRKKMPCISVKRRLHQIQAKLVLISD